MAGMGGASARKRRKVSAASDAVGSGPEAGPASSVPAAGPAADAAPGALTAVRRYTVTPSAACALNAALRIELEFVTAAALRGRRVHWRFCYVVDAVRQAASPRIALGRSDTHFCDDRPATIIWTRATFPTEGATKAALRNVGLLEASLHGEEDAAGAAPICACAVVVEVKGGDEMNGGDASVLVRTCFPHAGGGTAAAAAAAASAAAHA